MDIEKQTDDQLRAIIENHERERAFDKPLYAQALEEAQRREAPSLNLDISVKCILDAAAAQAFLSYGAVAMANNCIWSKVRRQMPKHLDRILSKAHARNAPLITSIVVNQTNLATGLLDSSSLGGFIAGAKRLGFHVNDPMEFLRQHQNATFAYAANNRAL